MPVERGKETAEREVSEPRADRNGSGTVPTFAVDLPESPPVEGYLRRELRNRRDLPDRSVQEPEHEKVRIVLASSTARSCKHNAADSALY